VIEFNYVKDKDMFCQNWNYSLLASFSKKIQCIWYSIHPNF